MDDHPNGSPRRNAWARLATGVGSLGRGTLAWGGVALALIILLAVNLISSISFGNWQADLTQGSLFTISDGTRQVLRKIDEPITMRLYFSKQLGQDAPGYGRYFDRVKSLLESYKNIAGGKLQISYLDPEPYSEEEDRAVAAGLRGVQLNEGETGYFGLTASNSTDNVQTIEFFYPEREGLLEYDLTKLIYSLANPKKRVVGVITSLPLDGAQMPANGQELPPWAIMDQLREAYDVHMLGQTVDKIPPDVDVLLIAQPYGLSPKTAYAIDQYVLGGGRALVFVDPIAEIAQMATLGQTLGNLDEIKMLLKSWGVDFDEHKVAADIAHARRVRFRGSQVTEYVGWLSLDQNSVNQHDVLGAGVDTINLASPGFLTKVPGAKTIFTPLLTTSPQAMQIDASKMGMGVDPTALLQSYQPGGTPLVLAARLSGEASTAFPDGPPAEAKPNDAAKKDDAANKDAEAGNPKSGAEAKPDQSATPDQSANKDAASAFSPTGPAAKPNDEASGQADTSGKPAGGESKPAGAAKSGLASGKINAIVFADTDMLADPFWVDHRQVLDQTIAVPTAQNGAMVISAVENLSGSDALIALRARGVADRPFTLVENLRRDAERRFREKEDALTQKLKQLQDELAKLDSSGADNGVLQSDEERKAAESYRSQMLETRRELRAVQLALNEDIDRLDGWLKFTNIALIPLVIGAGGVGWSLWRMRKEKGKPNSSREERT